MSMRLIRCSSSLIAVLGFAFSGAASADPDYIYRFLEGTQLKTQKVVRYGEERALITKECALSTDTCKALEALKAAATVRPELNPRRLARGAHPGAAICDRLEGEVVVGIDSAENEQTFCRFKDGSALSTGALAARAMRAPKGDTNAKRLRPSL